MKRFAAAVSALILAACTTTSTLQLAPDRIVLVTRGNAFTAPERVMRDVMVEAALRAQAGGYEWFVVEDSRDVSTSGVYVTPATGNAYASGNAFGWSGAASYTGARAYPYTKPGMQVAFRLGNGAMPAGAYNAAQVIALNPKR